MKKITLLFLTLILLLAGCSSESEIPNCSASNTDYIKYGWDAASQQCQVIDKIEKNQCGNGVKEKGETYCNCAEDVEDKTLSIKDGGCSGKKGDYLEYVCVQNSCELEMTDKVSLNSKALELKAKDFSLEVQVKYNEPFITDREEISTNFLLKSITNNELVKVKDLTIRKVSLLTKSNDYLSNKDVNKPLAKQYEELKVILPVNEYALNTFSEKVYNVVLRTFVDYTKETYDKQGELIKTETLSQELKTQLDKELELIDPSKDAEEETSSSSGWDNY